MVYMYCGWSRWATTFQAALSTAASTELNPLFIFDMVCSMAFCATMVAVSRAFFLAMMTKRTNAPVKLRDTIVIAKVIIWRKVIFEKNRCTWFIISSLF